jgi:hypothetical protein
MLPGGDAGKSRSVESAAKPPLSRQLQKRIGFMAFSAEIVDGELVLRIPLNAKPEKSASGKTLVVASTYGNKETDCVVDGKKVIVGVNASIPKK